MEDGLRQAKLSERKQLSSLNPCCNGRWSQTDTIMNKYKRTGLNPCCNGRWSQTSYIFIYTTLLYGLNPCCNGRWSQTEASEHYASLHKVLILVVMEDGLRQLIDEEDAKCRES